MIMGQTRPPVTHIPQGPAAVVAAPQVLFAWSRSCYGFGSALDALRF